jgi:hypothetical protein
MNVRWLVVTPMAVTCAAWTVGACATDDSVPFVDPSEQKVPELEVPPDAGVDGLQEGAGTDGGETKEPCPPDALCPYEIFATAPGGGLDTRTRIMSLRGRSASDVWAVGAQGTILHFDGVSWARSDSGTDVMLSGIWLRDSGEVAFSSLRSPLFTRGIDIPVGDAGAGSPSSGGWTVRPAPYTGGISGWLTSVWAPPGAEWLWATTMGGFEVTSTPPQNGIWRVHAAPGTNNIEVREAAPAKTCAIYPCRQLTSVHGASANDLWAVGYTGATIHVTDAQSETPKLTPLDSQTWANLYGVWAASETEAWSVGATGAIRHYTGATSWDIVSGVPTRETLRGIWGSSATDIWAVGDKAVVLHYDGKTWSQVPVAGLGDRKPDLYAVWTSAPGHVWAAGDGVLLSLGGRP